MCSSDLASTVIISESALYPVVLSVVGDGLSLDPSTSDNNLEARNTLSSISRFSKFLSLWDTMNFFAISALVDTILKHFEMRTLQSAVTALHFPMPTQPSSRVLAQCGVNPPLASPSLIIPLELALHLN